jgi:hypothetical protein
MYVYIIHMVLPCVNLLPEMILNPIPDLEPAPYHPTQGLILDLKIVL